MGLVWNGTPVPKHNFILTDLHVCDHYMLFHFVVNNAGSTVMTDVSTIHIYKIYELSITCTEIRKDFRASMPITTQSVNISFSTNCTSIEPSAIPQILMKNIATSNMENSVKDKVVKTTKHQRIVSKITPVIKVSPLVPFSECNKVALHDGFFEHAGSVAAVAATGGVMIGFSIALGWFILARRCHFCFLFPVAVRYAGFKIISTKN